MENLQNFNFELVEIIAVIMVILVIGLLVVTILNNVKKSKKEKFLTKRLTIIDKIEHINNIKETELIFEEILKLVKDLISGDGYYLYLFEQNNNHFRLKKVLYEDEIVDFNEKGIEVGYGRILSYEEKEYSPPLILPGVKTSQDPEFVMEGRFPVLIVPIEGKYGLITIRTKIHKNPEILETLKFLSSKMENIFKDLASRNLEKESEKISDNNKFKDKKNKNKNEDIMKFAIAVMGAKSGILINIENSFCNVLGLSGFDKPASEKINENIQNYADLDTLAENNFKVISMASIDYEKIPKSIKDIGLKYYALKKLDNSIFVCCYETEPEEGYFRDYREGTIELLMSKMVEYSMGAKYKRPVEFYLKNLEIIAGKIDLIEPYTIGNSELLRHFTHAISRQMGLSEEDITNFKLAACLSNLGVVILPERILLKKGVYDEEEYEAMKKHTQAGAFLVYALTGNSAVEEIIEYHHERFDGLGYHQGLKGTDIPLGSRILAVVQTFSSKIRGRNYREPMSFDKIITMIKGESGKALDGNIVNALIKWFIKKQKDPKFSESTLGPCWEMRCSPEEVCTGCMAYKKTDRYCWTFERNNCINHGNTCESCFIYTEFVNRKKVVEMEQEGDLS